MLLIISLTLRDIFPSFVLMRIPILTPLKFQPADHVYSRAPADSSGGSCRIRVPYSDLGVTIAYHTLSVQYFLLNSNDEPNPPYGDRVAENICFKG